MSRLPTFRKLIIFLTIVTMGISIVHGQLPECNKVYMNLSKNLAVSDSLLTYDPNLPVSATNPSINSITLPPVSLGLAISPVLGSGNNTLTYYTTSGQTFWYYDPATSVWVNTGDTIGPSTNVNIAGGGGFIYTLRGFGNAPGVYRYDGTGNAVNVAIAIAPLPYDLVADCEGNFYIISNLGPSWGMRKYNSNGVFLQGYTVNNTNNFFLSGGLARIGDNFYADDHNSNGIALGVFSGNVLNFNSVSAPIPILQTGGFAVNDMATCPNSIGSLATVSISPGDTTICNGAEIQYIANSTNTGGNTQYQWFVNGLAVSGATDSFFAFTPNANSEVKVEMQTSGGCANMTVTSPSSFVTLVNTDSFTINMPDIACMGDTIQITTNGSSNGNYTWNFGGGIITSGSGAGPYAVHWNEAGTHTIHVHAQSGNCISNDTAEINIKQGPQLSLTTSNINICIGDTILVKAFVDSLYNLQWGTGTNYVLTDEVNRNARFLIKGNDIITAQAGGDDGCMANASLPVTATSCCQLNMPSAFSPNGDNLNDRFAPVRKESINVLLFNVYNRWGQVVYSNTGNQQGWDGTFHKQPLDAGTYFYTIKYTCFNSNTIQQRKGDLTLVR